MRITGGTLRGRIIQTQRLRSARPTTDRARETIFNIIVNMLDIESTRVLDICAGSGALSFEALSRGASEAVLIEADRTNVTEIRSNATAFNCNDAMHIITGKAPQIFLSKHFSPYSLQSFDIIFCDPPYKLLLLNSIVNEVIRGNLLRRGGIFVAEHGQFERILCPPVWHQYATRNMGETIIDFFVFQ